LKILKLEEELGEMVKMEKFNITYYKIHYKSHIKLLHKMLKIGMILIYYIKKLMKQELKNTLKA